MGSFNIHWKGYPHHHLPRIRVASPHYGTVGGRRYAHIAALEAVNLPYGLALQRARLQQRMRIRRGKQGSRGSLGGTITSRRTSKRAMPDVKIHGGKSLQGDIGSKERENREPEVSMSIIQHSTDPIRLSDDVFDSDQSYGNPSLMTNGQDNSVFSMDVTGLDQTVDLNHPIKKDWLPSRTSTQLEALRHFRRELERHLVAQEAVRKGCLSISSPSSSTLSADTVVDFVPYLAEFQAAGLAVTSKEQRTPCVRQSWRNVLPLPLKDVGDNEQTGSKAGEEMNKGSPIASHDGSLGGLYGDTTSSGTTVIEFSSPRVPNSAVAYRTRNTATKRALPWLRNAPELSTLSQPIAGNGINANNFVRSSSASTAKTCATTIIESSPQPKVNESKQNQLYPSSVRVRRLDVTSVDVGDSLMKRKSRETGRHIAPEAFAPAPAEPQNNDTYSSKISGNIFPLAPSSKTNQRVQSALANPNTSKRGKTRPFDEAMPHSRRRILPVELISLPSTSLGSFRPSSKLLAQQRTSKVEDPEPTKVHKDVAAHTQKASVPLPPLPPAHSPTSPPIKDGPLASKLTYQSFDTSIPNHYNFENPFIFEKPLNIIHSSNLLQTPFPKEKRDVKNLPTTSSAHQGDCDPVKRRSTSYKPPELSSHDTKATMTSSLGSITMSETRTTMSTDQAGTRDKDVFKGLQIAMAAACNEDIDLWITEMSGCRVRRFLADLRAFEGLGVNSLVGQALWTAKRRRKEHNKRTRAHGHLHVPDREGVPSREKAKNGDRKTPAMVADGATRRGLLIAEMLGRREAMAGETVRERALAMGWRTRSLSAGY